MKILLLVGLLCLVQPLNTFAQAFRTSETALVVNGKWIKTQYDFNTKDGTYHYTYNGRRVLLDSLFKNSKDYLYNTIWTDMTTITYNGSKYQKFALPRALAFDDVVPVGNYNGVLVMRAKADTSAIPDPIYIPHKVVAGLAEFQTYFLKP